VVLGAAELHERPELADTGEIAFSVEPEHQRRGIGRRLFERLILHAHALDYTRLLVTTHPHNEAMKRLARGFQARLTFADGSTMGEIELQRPTDLDGSGNAAFGVRRGARLKGSSAIRAYTSFSGCTEEEIMARKPQSESVIDMFAKLGEQMKMPAPDIERVIEHHRKNLEAFQQSAQAAGEGTSKILARQREMLNETLEEFSAMAKEMQAGSDPQELMRKQAEFARKTFETAVKNTGEMADMVRKSNEESLEILRGASARAWRRCVQGTERKSRFKLEPNLAEPNRTLRETFELRRVERACGNDVRGASTNRRVVQNVEKLFAVAIMVALVGAVFLFRRRRCRPAGRDRARAGRSSAEVRPRKRTSSRPE
jgi:phasin family protein